MTFIPLAITYCSVVELLLQVFALVYGSYGEQHSIPSPFFLSIGNNMIPPQLLQRTTMVMLVPNLNLSMLLSQYAETMIPIYELVQIPLDSYEDLLFVQERLAIYYSMLERSLRLSYGQHDIEWCQQFTAHQYL
jgi:hypothetical protein